MAKQILRRKWGWIGHTLRKPASSTTPQALTWNPQGKRKRGRPRNSWRQDTEAELKQQGTNWSGMTRATQNRVRWRGSLMVYAPLGALGISKQVLTYCIWGYFTALLIRSLIYTYPLIYLKMVAGQWNSLRVLIVTFFCFLVFFLIALSVLTLSVLISVSNNTNIAL